MYFWYEKPEFLQQKCNTFKANEKKNKKNYYLLRPSRFAIFHALLGSPSETIFIEKNNCEKTKTLLKHSITTVQQKVNQKQKVS